MTTTTKYSKYSGLTFLSGDDGEIRPGKGVRRTEHRMERRTLRQQVWLQIGQEAD